MKFFGQNRHFLANYRGYVNKEWAGYYFSYDFFKAEYKKLKGHDRLEKDLEDLDNKLLAEIQRVHKFLALMVQSVGADIDSVATIVDKLEVSPTKSAEQADQIDRSVEISLRSLYEKINQCDEFFQLNHFVISKTTKKMEKLLAQQEKGTVSVWGGYSSGRFFYDDFSSSGLQIQEIQRKCVDVYTVKFRKKYSQLAKYELKYAKNKDDDHKQTRFYIGAKLGLAIAVIFWIMLDSNSTPNELDFWQQPGLFVYTTIGNLLLYRLGWAGQIYIWSRFGVNYISALNLSIIRPNLVLVVNQTCTLLLLFSFNLLMFFKSNSQGSVLYSSFFSYGCPVFLLAAAGVYQVYEYYYLLGGQRCSRGVFTSAVLKRCFSAPFVPVRFRDVYAADILTSFTRIISDSLYASCWVFSGSFLTPHSDTSNSATDFGTSSMQCTNHNMAIFTGLISLVPLIIRTLQCLRTCRDGGWKMFPQGYNALKYILSMGVVGFALANPESDRQTAVIYTLVVITTLYKWWWDVVMDWGLCEILPQSLEEALRLDLYLVSKMWLRKVIMYPYLILYFFCIGVDLILRFTWVISLLPNSSFAGLVGYQLSFFLGSLEIMRRCMWGCFRIEWEHIKFLRQGAPGYLSTPVIRGFAENQAERYDDQPAVAIELKQPAGDVSAQDTLTDICRRTVVFSHSTGFDDLDEVKAYVHNPMSTFEIV